MRGGRSEKSCRPNTPELDIPASDGYPRRNFEQWKPKMYFLSILSVSMNHFIHNIF